MCFKIITPCQKARKDILVKKRINKNGFGWLFSLEIKNEKGKFQIEPWTKGYHYSEANFPKNKHYGVIGGDAFHSFEINTTKGHWLVISEGFDGVDKTIIGRIPKGSYYFYNKIDKEYCSQDFIYDKDL